MATTSPLNVSLVALISCAGLLLVAGTALAQTVDDLAAELRKSVGVATQSTFLRGLGAPAATLKVDGDDVWVYYLVFREPLLDTADILSGFSAGVQGRQHIPYPRARRQVILHFSPDDGKLKSWAIH